MGERRPHSFLVAEKPRSGPSPRSSSLQTTSSPLPTASQRGTRDIVLHQTGRDRLTLAMMGSNTYLYDSSSMPSPRGTLTA